MTEKSKKILIVEDEKPIAKALELKLKHEGFDAKCAFNGEMALKVLEEEKFDLILSDLVMPTIDGFGFLQRLKDQKNHTPVIILSNLNQQEDQKKAMELGAKDFFVKSNTPLSVIVTHVRDFLK